MPKVNHLNLSPLPIAALFALEQLGQRIAACRKQKKLSQKDVADALGISKTTYIAVEHGKETAQIGHYARAIWLLEVPGTFIEDAAIVDGESLT
ncbi:helix-turn-helix domain-containing protein [Leeia sp. TBRC 13508]|uniref:Helix-turn-helix domain-containing protein n=1 Tax=Leeia speluncae TaxID=2884804 RepID=A0ABS8DA98_9NEIS|nr:helix-turn-helix domain-containing protein [Leeia speluncae]MCB6185138.1 helix-turn-helix domain-containing protein [Leeia speluncae]